MTLDLRRFDTFSPEEIRALPKKLRRQVEANRKARVTAALRRVVANRGAVR